MILISEDIWGAPFEELEGSFPIRRAPDLWQSPSELKASMVGVAALVIRNRTTVDDDLIAASPDLKIIARAGVGLDNIDIKAADKAGIYVVAGLGANAKSVGELTVGLALSLLRNIPEQNLATKKGEWKRTAGIELSSKTWGLLGCGATGVATAALLQGFGLTLLGYDPYAKPDGIKMMSMEEVLKQSDIVSIHLPSTPETNRLINAQTLAMMKKSSYLINVGRGEVINEADLVSALKGGVISGAALDVRDSEPPTLGELEQSGRVILTPHIAGITSESQLKINNILTSNIALVLGGSKPTHSVGAVK